MRWPAVVVVTIKIPKAEALALSQSYSDLIEYRAARDLAIGRVSRRIRWMFDERRINREKRDVTK